MKFDIYVSSIGFEGKDRKLVSAECVTEDIIKLIIEKYGNAANRIEIDLVECYCGETCGE